MKNSKKLKAKLSKRYDGHIFLTTDPKEKEEISISALAFVDDNDIAFIKKAIKGHLVNYIIRPASGSCFIKITSDEE